MDLKSKARRLIWIVACALLDIPLVVAQSYAPTVPLSTPADCYTAPTTTVSLKTVQSSIHISSAADVASLRSALIAQIWGNGTLPTATVATDMLVPTVAPNGTNPGNLATNASGLYPFLSS